MTGCAARQRREADRLTALRPQATRLGRKMKGATLAPLAPCANYGGKKAITRT